MDRDLITKALECCASDQYLCSQCPIDEKIKDDCECGKLAARNALALIKELTQECKKWQGRIKIECDYTKADTVKKIKTRFAMHFGTYTDKDQVKIADVFRLLDQIAKEMEEGI